MRIFLRFRWYDLWVGAYIDRVQRILYVCLVPCVVLVFQFPQRVAKDET